MTHSGYGESLKALEKAGDAIENAYQESLGCSNTFVGRRLFYFRINSFYYSLNCFISNLHIDIKKFSSRINSKFI